MATKASESAATKPTITVNFSEDPEVYKQIVESAKRERRTPAQFLLLYLVDNLTPESATSE